MFFVLAQNDCLKETPDLAPDQSVTEVCRSDFFPEKTASRSLKGGDEGLSALGLSVICKEEG